MIETEFDKQTAVPTIFCRHFFLYIPKVLLSQMDNIVIFLECLLSIFELPKYAEKQRCYNIQKRLDNKYDYINCQTNF